MEYKELSKLFYSNPGSSRDSDTLEEYLRRFNAESTFRLGYETEQGELFIAVPKELSVLSEKVLRNERNIHDLLSSLPEIASSAVLRGLVLDEVVSTNAIEDIQSTRRQVKDALESAEESPRNEKRFRELAILYLNIIDDKAKVPTCAKDIREIYDEVTSGEIPEGKLPDGIIFRAQGVEIIQGGARVVHRGIEPEERIVSAIEKMLEIVGSESIPALYAALVSHYLFEYAHPFYDGNGRTGRYLLSLFLSKVLSPATALCLSRVIMENRASYYRAFKSVEKPLNHAELTFFVHAMLGLVFEAQEQLKERLGGCICRLDVLRDVLSKVEAQEGLKEQEAKLVNYILQYESFALVEDVALSELANHLGLKDQMARKHLAQLEKKGIVVRFRKRNPLSFRLTDWFKDTYLRA